MADPLRVQGAAIVDGSGAPVRLKGTNHIFTTGGAIETVISHLTPWVERLRS